MNFLEKIKFLENILTKPESNFADSYKADILMFFNDDFVEKNPIFTFLEKLNSKEEIEDWVNKLTSRLVMRIDEDDKYSRMDVDNIIDEYILK